MPKPPPVRAGARRRAVPHTVLAGIVAFVIPFVHGLAPAFVYDAAQYFNGAAAIVAGEPAIVPGGLSTRGVFTAAVYLVPASATAILGLWSAPWTVLAWNAALGAAVCAFLLPRLAGLIAPVSSSRPPASRVWVSAILGSVLLSGFAPFPLVDVWSTSLALAGFYAMATGRRWWSLSLAGISFVVAVNLRPSLIAPILLAVVFLLIMRPRALWLAAPAAVLALVPQLMLNTRTWGLMSLAPPETGPLVAVQARWAAFALRYDTVAFADQAPQQWFCDPDYAALLVGDDVPSNQLGVLASALQHLPDSVWFLTRKVAANLHWSWMTPYENPPSEATSPMTVLVLLVSSFGLVAIVVGAIRCGSDRTRRLTILAFLAFWFGALGTLMVSTPETRFALPVVMIGAIGVIAAVPARLRLQRPRRVTVFAAVLALILAAFLFGAGREALGHHLAPGPLPDALTCSLA